MPKFAVEIINTRDEGFIYTGHETRGVQFTRVVVVGSRIKPGEAGTWLAKYTYISNTYPCIAACVFLICTGISSDVTAVIRITVEQPPARHPWHRSKCRAVFEELK